MPRPLRREHLQGALPVLVPVAIATALAVWALNFGLPYLFRPDEDVMVGRSVRIVVEHNLDPLFYNYPPLAFYLFAAAEQLAQALGYRIGATTAVDPSAAYLAARAVSALAFAACTAFVFAAARAIEGRTAGFLAATCMALAPLAVRQAHFATTDGLATAFVAAAIWAGLQGATRPASVLAGVLCGLAGATKYTAGLVLVLPLAMVIGERDWQGRALATVAGAAIAFVAVVAVVGHPLEQLQGLTFLAGRAGQKYADLPIGIVYHPTASLLFGLGLGTYALAIVGALLAVARRRRAEVALLCFLVVYLIAIGFSHEVFYRYVLPMLPGLCVLAGGVTRLIPEAGPGRAALLAAALLLQAPSAYASVTTDRLLAATDTRRQAADWLLQNAPAGAELRISSYWGQPLYDRQELGKGSLHAIYATGDPVADSFQQGRFTDRLRINRDGAPCFTVAESGPPWQAPMPETRGHPAAVFTPYPSRPPSSPVYDPIDSFYLPFWDFEGIDRPGPSIAISQAC